MAIKDQSRSAATVSVELFREMGEFGLPPVTARYKGRDMLDALFVGVTADHLQLINATLAEGRFFTEAEDLHRRDVAVIGNGVRERFFQNGDPVGKTIVVDGHSLEIIGTLTKFKSFLGDDQNDKAILIPYKTFKKAYPEANDNFICVLVKPGRMNQAKDEVSELLRRRRHVKPAEPDNFGISSAEAVISQFRQVISTVALVMVVISSIGLLVGGIGVMNIMLVSVTERTREIGVRKAIGARRSDIAWQFLLEAMTLTGIRRHHRHRAGLAAQPGDSHVGSQPAFHGAAMVRRRRLYCRRRPRPVLRYVAGLEGRAARSHRGVALRVARRGRPSGFNTLRLYGSGSRTFAVRLDGPLYSRRRIGKVLRIHCRTKSKAGIERQEPGLGCSRHLR